jgi:23S rRNA G2445 N2-methylase RlmL
MLRAVAKTLRERVEDPGFTPAVRDVAGLVDLLADDGVADSAERAIGRVGAPAVPVLRARLREARAPLRGRVVRAIGRVARAEDDDATALLLGALDDGDPKARRNAAIALGHVAGPRVEAALLRAWESDPRVEMRRSLAASLGKIGGERTLPVLRAASAADDAQLAQIARRAAMMVARTGSRAAAPGVGIDADAAPASPVDAIALARDGLEDLLAEELRAIASLRKVRVVGAGRVALVVAGPLRDLFAARTMLSFHFPLAAERVASGEPAGEGSGDGDGDGHAIARALASEAARRIFATWTAGGVRYRLAWAHGGHRRAATWAAAEAIARHAPALVNDPTSSNWEVAVALGGGAAAVSLAPRGLDDPRFVWRVGDVPAASHPTIAAALARVSGVRADDVVWDPFVGSGAELVERARLGPYRALLGSDRDPRALEVARKNLAAAGLTADLALADALEHAPPGVTLVVTNPPMGRRAARAPALGATLDRFVAHAARVLVPRGRLVWIAPWPERSRAAAQAAGMTLESARDVDMGGFTAQLQRWSRSRS